MKKTKSEGYFKRSCKVTPGGVNSPVRAFTAVGGNPPFIEKGEGSRIYDVDGNEYIDFLDGKVALDDANSSKYVRCVKSWYP